MDWRLKAAAACLALGVQGALPLQAAAPDSRPITLIVPFGVGGSTDITARLLADKLGKVLGQTVVVENRGGAGGNIGAAAVARAQPDGHTLLMATSTHVTNPALYKDLNYDVMEDLAPVSRVAFIPNMLVVNNKLPVQTLEDFVAYVRQGKGPAYYGSSGSGTSQHLAGVLFASMADGKMTHVPYKGGGAASMAVLSGEIQAYFAPMAEVVSHVEAGSVKGLGVTTKKRSERFPDVQAIAEVLPGYELALWNGILTTAGSPPAQIDRLNRAIAQVLKDPDMRSKLAEQGSVPAGNTPEEFGAFMRAELKTWARLVELSGASVN